MKRINFTFIQSGGYWPDTADRLTKQAVEDVFNQLSPTEPGVHFPLMYEGLTIGYIDYAAYIEGEDSASIAVEAIITDQNLIDQAWLRLEQIGRSAIFHGLERVS